MLAALAMTITELLTTTPKSYTDEFKAITELLYYSVVPILVGVYISKRTFKRRKKKETQSLDISVKDQTENNDQIEENKQIENNAQTENKT